MTQERENTSDRDDPILDACLEELLAGPKPPDLTARIMAALDTRQMGARQDGASPARPSRLTPIPVAASRPAAVVSTPASVASKSNAKAPVRSRSRRAWVPAALAASLLIAALGYGIHYYQSGKSTGGAPTIAGTQRPQQQAIAGTRTPPANEHRRPAAGTSEPAADNASPNPAAVADQTGSPGSAAPAQSVAVDSHPTDTQSVNTAAEPAPDSPAPTPGSRANDHPPESAVATAEDPTSPASAVNAAVSSDEDVVAYINELIRQRWKEGGVSPSPVATDAEWCRRLYLDLLGRIPTAAETMRFVNDRSRGKREALVNRLLDSDEYLEEYARNWTTVWTNILIGRTGGTQQGTLVSREGLQQYLRRSFLKNKPYNQMAMELVSAKGVNAPGQEGFNGAVNFLLDNLAENATPATAKSARIFLGLQVQCTQCHNHPFNEWKQNQFWELNAFFRQAHAEPLAAQAGQNMGPVRLVDLDFAGEGTDPSSAEIYYEMRNGLLKVAYPVFVDGTKVDASGFVAEVDRRDQLADLIGKSPYLSKAIVNRLWGHFLGFGFTKPIDDMGPHNPATHPDLLERLARDFAGHGHDLKQLVRWITLSEAYSLSSRSIPKNEKDNPTLGEQPLFSHFYLRQMQPEELYHSLLVATGAQESGGGDYAAQERRKAEWLAQFSIAFGTDEGGESTSFNGTIPQTLMMWNGDLIQKATSGDTGTYLHTVATTDSKSSAKIDQLFLTALARKPTSTERRAADDLWRLRGGDSLAALEDIWWVVLNTNEFIFNH